MMQSVMPSGDAQAVEQKLVIYGKILAIGSYSPLTRNTILPR
jgi:hypothetical protein